MKSLRNALAAAVAVAVAGTQAALAAVGGGAVESRAMGLIDWMIVLVIAVIPAFVVVWGLRLGSGVVALGGIAFGAIGLLIAANAVDVGALFAR